MRVRVRDAAFDIDADRLGGDESALRRQLREYERGERERFDLDVRYPDGYLGDVMREMSAIPYGETRTYGDLAERLDSHAVAVGQACGANPVPVVVPCHRVVGADGLGGFSSPGGVDAKRQLLAFERGERSLADW